LAAKAGREKQPVEIEKGILIKQETYNHAGLEAASNTERHLMNWPL
jgi:hypothetical protein